MAALQLHYDMVSTTAKYSTCLDLTTSLSLAAPVTVIRPGGTVTLGASLIVTDLAASEELGGNLVSGRPVTLQRRLPGAAAWTTVATMPAGVAAGTYSLGQQPTTDMDYRAVFATQTTEGLEGSTSPTLHVYMANCPAGFTPAARIDVPCI